MVFISSALLFSANASDSFAAVRINEIMYDLPGSDKTDSGLGREWIELFNERDEPITLKGGNTAGSWRVIDSAGAHLLAKEPFTGSMTLSPQGYAILAADAETFLKEHPHFRGTIIDTVLNLKNSQDLVKLRDGEGNIISEVFWTSAMGAAGNGRTLEFANNVWREGLRDGGSPGLENSIENVLLPEAPLLLQPSPTPSLIPSTTATIANASLAASPTPKPLLVISEFLPNPAGSDAEGEWIELKNEGMDPVNLEGWSLSTNSSGRDAKLSGTLGAGAFLVVPRKESRLSLKNSGDSIFLKAPGGTIAVQVTYAYELPAGWAAARFGAVWKPTNKPTPGKPNELKPDDFSASLRLQELPAQTPFPSPPTEETAQNQKIPTIPRQAYGRIPWILFSGLLLGACAACVAIFLKRKMMA